MFIPLALPFAKEQKCAISFQRSWTVDIINSTNISSGTGFSCECVQDVNSVITKWSLPRNVSSQFEQFYMQMEDRIALFLYPAFFSNAASPPQPFLLCFSRLNDKHCLLAINPEGVLTGVPIKRSIFSPFWWVCRGPRGSQITLEGGGRGGGGDRGEAISSVLTTHAERGAHGHTCDQKVRISTWMDNIRWGIYVLSGQNAPTAR